MDEQTRRFLQRFCNTPAHRLATMGLDDHETVALLKVEADRLLDADGQHEAASTLREYILSYRRESDAARVARRLTVPGDVDGLVTHSVDGAYDVSAAADATQELIEQGVRRFATDKQQRCYFAVRGGMTRADYGRSMTPPVSRARVTKMMQSAVDWGIAGAIIIAAEERSEETASAVFSASFQCYHPACLDVTQKLDCIAAEVVKRPDELARLRRGLQYLGVVAAAKLRRVYATDRDNVSPAALLSVPAASLILFVVSRVQWGLLDGFREELRELRHRVVRRHNAACRRILATVESYDGSDEAQIEHLRADRGVDAEVVCMHYFLNRDRLWTQSYLQSGDVADSIDRINAHPADVAEKLAASFVARLGNPNEYSNEGISLMRLAWVRRATELIVRQPTARAMKSLKAMSDAMDRFDYRLRDSREVVRLAAQRQDAIRHAIGASE